MEQDTKTKTHTTHESHLSDPYLEALKEAPNEVYLENPFHTARLKAKRKGKTPPKILAVVHQSGCTGCEVCIAGCPVDSIELVPGPDPKNPAFQQTVEIDLARCIGCQNCSQDCPWETITMYPHDDAFIAWSRETLKSDLYISQENFQMKLNQIGPELKVNFIKAEEEES